MSPTIFRAGRLRFYFFSREEPRLHVHVEGGAGEAKFWLEPRVAVAENHDLKRHEVTRALRLIQEHEDEIRAAWKAHFAR